MVSSPYNDSNTADSGIAAYGTTRVDATPSRASPTSVIAFYRRALPRRGWRVVDLSTAPSISLRRGDAYTKVPWCAA